AAALVHHHIREGQSRLRLIATRLPKGKDPATIGRELDHQMDPPGIFLEIALVEAKDNPEVLVQSQLSTYNKLLNDHAQSNRTFNPRLNQQVTNWANGMGNIDVPLKGGEFVADELEFVKDVPALPLSVPGPEKRVLTGNLDLRPLSPMLAAIAAESGETLGVTDGKGRIVAGNALFGGEDKGIRRLVTERPVGLATLKVQVTELDHVALAPLR